MNDNISLLDYFAVYAMQGLIGGDEELTFEEMASKAYAIADAMLKEHDEHIENERELNPPPPPPKEF